MSDFFDSMFADWTDDAGKLTGTGRQGMGAAFGAAQATLQNQQQKNKYERYNNRAAAHNANVASTANARYDAANKRLTNTLQGITNADFAAERRAHQAEGAANAQAANTGASGSSINRTRRSIEQSLASQQSNLARKGASAVSTHADSIRNINNVAKSSTMDTIDTDHLALGNVLNIGLSVASNMLKAGVL